MEREEGELTEEEVGGNTSVNFTPRGDFHGRGYGSGGRGGSRWSGGRGGSRWSGGRGGGEHNSNPGYSGGRGGGLFRGVGGGHTFRGHHSDRTGSGGRGGGTGSGGRGGGTERGGRGGGTGSGGRGGGFMTHNEEGELNSHHREQTGGRGGRGGNSFGESTRRGGGRGHYSGGFGWSSTYGSYNNHDAPFSHGLLPPQSCGNSNSSYRNNYNSYRDDNSSYRNNSNRNYRNNSSSHQNYNSSHRNTQVHFSQSRGKQEEIARPLNISSVNRGGQVHNMSPSPPPSPTSSWPDLGTQMPRSHQARKRPSTSERGRKKEQWTRMENAYWAEGDSCSAMYKDGKMYEATICHISRGFATIQWTGYNEKEERSLLQLKPPGAAGWQTGYDGKRTGDFFNSNYAAAVRTATTGVPSINHPVPSCSYSRTRERSPRRHSRSRSGSRSRSRSRSRSPLPTEGKRARREREDREKAARRYEEERRWIEGMDRAGKKRSVVGGQATGGKLQQRMAKLEEEQERMKEEKLDMKRQSYKKNIVLYGSDLPPQSVGENPLQLFIELIHAHYNIILNRSHIANCHRLGKKGFVATFLWRGPHTKFRELIKAGKKPNLSGKNVRVSLHRMGEDRHLERVCQKLKGEGVLEKYHFEDFNSGKMMVWKRGCDFPKVVSSEKDLLMYLELK